MEIVAWIILVAFIVLGLLGSIFPGLPGLPLLVVGAVVHKIILPTYLSWFWIAMLGVLCLLSLVVELVGTVYGAKKWGKASRNGLIGAAVGGLLGIFFMPFGLLLGPAIGAFVGEVLTYRSMEESLRSAMGTGIGFGFSFVLRVVFALASVTIVLFDLIF